MAPTIILNKATTNPAIPRVPVYGFLDTFDRPNADILGATSREAKPWMQLNAANTAFRAGVRDNAMAPILTGATGPIGVYAVEAEKSDGIFSVRFAATTEGIRPAFRMQDSTNFLCIVVGTSSVQLRRYINNALTNLGSASIGVTLGKDITVEMKGPAVSVKVDGTTVIGPITVADFAAETKHGVQMVSSVANMTSGRVDQLSFS